MEPLQRCRWAGADPVMQAYHDTEWGVPQHDSRMLWEMLMLEGFQAGLAWSVILRKRPAFRAAFAGFDPETVARFGPADVDRLLADQGIVRSRAKIEATIGGARAYLALRERGPAFAEFAWAFTGGMPLEGDGVALPAKTPLSEEMARALRGLGFKFVGPVIVYAWMQAVGMVDDHEAGCFRRGAAKGGPPVSSRRPSSR